MSAGTKRRYSFYTPELNLMAESEASDASTPAVAYEYVWFNGRPVAQVDVTASTTSWTLTDHLGAPVLQTDSAGTVSWRAEHEPFGRLFALRGTDQHQPLRLPGQEAEQFEQLPNGGLNAHTTSSGGTGHDGGGIRNPIHLGFEPDLTYMVTWMLTQFAG
jgi:hypothetical protein